MRAKQVGNKADKIVMVVSNSEASVTIPRGSPLVLKLTTTASNTFDGLGVVLPSTAGNPLSYAVRYGVATDAMAVNQLGESILFGVCNYALITRATRAATTDSWSASASTASGIALGVDTINNAFLMGASIAGSIATNHVDAVLLDSLSSIAASASATTDSNTAITVGARIFVRML